jgi:hypothetical protein
VTPARHLVRDEAVSLLKGGKRKDKRRYILFNDMLLLVKPAKMAADRLVVVALYPLDAIVLADRTWRCNKSTRETEGGMHRVCTHASMWARSPECVCACVCRSPCVCVCVCLHVWCGGCSPMLGPW